MNNILYISGDGIRDQIASKIYTKYFISDAKNYFISKEIKLLVGNCDIINFSWWFGHPRFILKLESSALRGTTRIKIITMKIINFISRIIIYWKIIINSFDLIVFSDNLFFLDIHLIKSIKKLTDSKIIFLSGVSPKYLLPQSHKECLPYFDNIFISDPAHKVEWEDIGAQDVCALPLSAACPMTFQEIINKNKDNKCYDIVFIGNLDIRAYEYRLELLNFLISRGINIKIWTYMQNKDSLKNYSLIIKNIQGSAYGKDMIHIYSQSKIVLNFHSPTVPSGGNMRLFEIPLTNALQIADRCPNKWFSDKIDIVLFTDKYDLLNKIDFYLNHEQERARISYNGHRRFLSEHTYHHRVKKILSTIHH